MKISEINKSKQLKYNNIAPIDLNAISEDELERALIEFSEGSKGLENCLRNMWTNGLKTHACCAGEEDDYEIAYIAMSEDVDLFSYLSDELLLNEMVVLESDLGNQVIRFGGTVDEKDALMQKVSECILTGKKDNGQLVQRKIGVDFPEMWLKEARIFSMRQAGYSEEDITKFERELEINKMLINGNLDSDFMNDLAQLNNKLVEKYDVKKK